ncbi:hypothetical protein OEA41_006168 [Lepraria neglecta]|uniref:DUF6604 domain-containing protein n=1 Tax=Lepraria neglecta TaxID=209136 RepID=A0AAE0DMT6_9LECA|nr:hypothetical protein OEA41_006168 [Lepraria neglecta]
MLPDVLYHNYQQYKCDTDCFVSWLAETAIICGHAVRSYPAPVVVPSSISDDGPVTTGGVTTGRLKGKARKEAKIAAKKAVSSRPAPKQMLALNEIADLTNKIARYRKKSVQLPSPVLHAVQRGIAARKECNAWFQGQEVEGEERNDTPVYFVEVLEKTFEILRPITPRPSQTAEAAAKGASPKLDLKQQDDTRPLFSLTNNIFANLDIEDISDEDLEVPETKAEIVCQDIRVNNLTELSMYRLEKSKEDLEFAIFCLLRDLHRVEDYLHRLWAQYHDNKAGAKVDIMTVSLTTNFAIRLVRQAETSFLDDYPQFADNLDYLELLHKKCYSLSSVRVRHDIGPTAQHFYATPVKVLGELLQYVRIHTEGLFIIDKDIARCEGEFFRPYDPRRDRCSRHSSGPKACKLEFKAKAQEDKYLLAKLFHEALISDMDSGVSSIPSTLPVTDELMGGLVEMIFNRRFSLNVVFAAQVYLKFHDIMRENVLRGFLDLRFAELRVDKIIRNNGLRCSFIDTWIHRDVLTEKKKIMRRYALGDTH